MRNELFILLGTFAVACGGKAIIDAPLDDDGAGGTTTTTTTTTDATTTTSVGGAPSTTTTSVGGNVPELCTTVCGQAETCLASSFDECVERCAQQPAGCEGIHNEYLACHLQATFEACVFDELLCFSEGLTLLECQQDFPLDFGCAGGGPCMCEINLTSGKQLQSECVGNACQCSIDGDVVGVCTNGFANTCDPIANCCTALYFIQNP